MPKYTLVHGGLVRGHTLHLAGTPNAEIELDAEEAQRLNRRIETVRPSAVIEAEREADEKRKKAVEAAEKKAALEEEKAADEKRKKGGHS